MSKIGITADCTCDLPEELCNALGVKLLHFYVTTETGCFKDMAEITSNNIVEYLKKSDELVLISKNRYGCYSNEVKRVLERCLGYVLPYFNIRNKEIHHQSRYKKKLKLITYFYGEFTSNDKKCIKDLVRANAINLNISKYKIYFLNNVKELINVYNN